MNLRTLILTPAALASAAVFAGAAAADTTPPGPTGETPTLAAVEPASTLLLPRGVRPGATASVVLRLDPSAASELQSERVTCLFLQGTRQLVATPTTAGDAARCTVRVPRSAAGTTIRGALRVVLSHVAIERPFSFKVARR